MKKKSVSRRIFDVVNVILLVIIASTCILPFLNMLAISFSSQAAVGAGQVAFLPVDFTLSSYEFVIGNPKFIRSFLISIERVILGLIINLTLIVLVAYPLSKSKKQFKQRNLYAWYFIISMIFVPALIPSFLVVNKLGLIDRIWALVLPTGLPVFSMIVMLNFFRNLPNELEEAAFIDGASHWTILFKLYIPLSKPSLATVALFSIVFHWNSWFDGMIYMNNPMGYPLQSYLQTIMINPAQLLETAGNDETLIALLNVVGNKTAKAAQLFVATIPVLIAYPFLQKYFTTGLVLGSVKG